MFDNSKGSFNLVPENIPPNPFNHTLDRKDQVSKKVTLRIKEDIHNMVGAKELIEAIQG